MSNEPNFRSTGHVSHGYDLETPFVDFGELSDSSEQFETAPQSFLPLPPVEAALVDLTPFDNEMPPTSPADFQIAYNRTMRKEGGYANNPNDSGGETYRGIARKFHAAWTGWSLIDAAKKQPNFPKALDTNQQLQTLVADFYRTEFWNKVRAGEIYSQAIANELFDSAVNHGIPPAVKILQQAVNYLIAPPLLFLAVDGQTGPATIAAVNRWLKSSSLEFLVATNTLLCVMLVLRAKLYVRIIDNKPSQKVFFEGWIRRILGPPSLMERGT